MRRAITCVGVTVMLAGSAAWARPQADAGRDRSVVEQTIRDSICWAVAGAKSDLVAASRAPIRSLIGNSPNCCSDGSRSRMAVPAPMPDFGPDGPPAPS